MTKRAKIILTILLGILIIVPMIFWATQGIINTQSSESIIKDKDTGETLDTADKGEQTGGAIAKKSDIVLFGTKNLAKVAREKNTQTGRYLIAIQDALWEYGETRLKKEFPTLTVRPQNLVVTAKQISGDIRIGQTDTILPFKADITKNNTTAIVTINENGSEYDGVFIFVGGLETEDELLFTITQKNSTSTDLIIESYGGYWEASLQYLTSLGYSVPDFSIELVNQKGVL